MNFISETDYYPHFFSWFCLSLSFWSSDTIIPNASLVKLQTHEKQSQISNTTWGWYIQHIMPHVQNVCLMFGAVESDEPDERLSNFLQKQNCVKCNISEVC